MRIVQTVKLYTALFMATVSMFMKWDNVGYIFGDVGDYILIERRLEAARRFHREQDKIAYGRSFY